jgi:hypothetical protein
MLRRPVQPLLYLWALPMTLLGIIEVAIGLATGAKTQVVRGVLEVHGGWVTWLLTRGMPWMQGGAAAMTLGHVILGCDEVSLDRARLHEHVHVRQCERWGPLFGPAYLLASLVQWLRGRDPYRDNPFEVEAYAISDAADAREA